MSRPDRTARAWSDPPPAPFVVGAARSGTTLLRLVLDAHPQLTIPPETHFAYRVIDAFRSGDDGVERAVGAIVESRFWPDFGMSADDLRRAARGAPATPGSIMRAFYELYAERAGKPRWGDKTPPYLDRMSPIQEALPEARFVHIVRDGRDVALSVIPLWFGPSDVAEAARQWSDRIQAARIQAAGLHGYLELRYEDLVCDPAASLRRVCRFLELPWDPAMLDHHLHAGERLAELARDMPWRDGRVIGASERLAIHERAAQRIRADRMGRWRSEMSLADRRAFERIAGETLAELGYELGAAAGSGPRPATPRPAAASPFAGDRIDPDEIARVGRRYESYAQDRRRQRAWAAENPGNAEIRAELLEALWALAADGLTGGGARGGERSPGAPPGPDPEDGGVLDAGCGTGYWLRALIDRGVAPQRLHGVELLPERLAASRARVPEAVSLRQADVRDLPYPDGRFDALLLLTVLSSLASPADVRRALIEAARVVRPGGAVLIYESRLPAPLGARTVHVPLRAVRDALGPLEARPVTVWPPLARRLGRLTARVYPALAGRPWACSHRLVAHRLAG